LNGGNTKVVANCPAGLRRFRKAHGAAGPRRDLLRKLPMGVSTYEVLIKTPGENAARRATIV
jgi:hypothetical protein